VTTSEPHGAPGSDPTVGCDPSSATAASPDPAPAQAPPASTPTRPARNAGRTIGRAVALALLVFVTVVLVLFVVFNTQTVDISLVFVDVNAPLVVALLIAAVLGGAVVGLLDTVMTVRGRRKNR
jgi:uncharacterized integral membrane protein